MGQEGRIDAVLEPPAAEKADLLVQALQLRHRGQRLRDRDRCPQWFPPEGALRLEMARSLLDTDRVAIHDTALPPLAATALAASRPASRRACRAPACSPRCCPSSRPQLHAFTWLGSVSGLNAPRAEPSASTSPRSAPSSAFGVSSWPEPAVHKLSAGEPGVPLPAIQRPSRLVVAAAQRRRRVGDRHGQQGARRPAGRRGRADAARPELVGHRASWSRAWSARSTSTGWPPRSAGRAGAVGLPLVRRADRPLAVPAVRPPWRAPKTSPAAAPASARRARRRWPGRGSCPCPGRCRSSTRACRSARPRRSWAPRARSRRARPGRSPARSSDRRSASGRRRGRWLRSPPQPDQRRSDRRISELTSIVLGSTRAWNDESTTPMAPRCELGLGAVRIDELRRRATAGGAVPVAVTFGVTACSEPPPHPTSARQRHHGTREPRASLAPAELVVQRGRLAGALPVADGVRGPLHRLRERARRRRSGSRSPARDG